MACSRSRHAVTWRSGLQVLTFWNKCFESTDNGAACVFLGICKLLFGGGSFGNGNSCTLAGVHKAKNLISAWRNSRVGTLIHEGKKQKNKKLAALVMTEEFCVCVTGNKVGVWKLWQIETYREKRQYPKFSAINGAQPWACLRPSFSFSPGRLFPLMLTDEAGVYFQWRRLCLSWWF